MTKISKKDKKKVILLTVVILLLTCIAVGWVIYTYALPKCSPGIQKCADDGKTVLQCSYDGKGFSTVDICQDACAGSGCVQYQNNNPLTCGDNVCEPSEFELGQDVTTIYCTDDCDICDADPPVCGNSKCEVYCNIDEFKTCPKDCGGTQVSFEEYETLRQLNGISDDYLKESKWYDYSSSYIQQLKQQLKRDTPEETVKAIAKWTFDNVDYDDATLEGHLYDDCMNTPASEIIQRGFGICSTQSKVNIALLRSFGLASRMVSGCYAPKGSCAEYLVLPEKGEFKWIQEDNVYVVTGYAHAWVEVWLPDKGWVLVESTAGRLHPDSCLNYDRYYESADKFSDLCGFSKSVADICRAW